MKVIVLLVLAGVFGIAFSRIEVVCPSEAPIPAAFIITLKNGIDQKSPNFSKKVQQKLTGISKIHHITKKPFKSRFLRKLNFLALENIEDKDLEHFQNDTDVESIECDFYVYHNQLKAPSWGIDRVVSSRSAIDGIWRYPLEAQGEGVHVFIIDTGVYSNHVEYRDRVDTLNSVFYVGTSIEDDHGHGSHCAGTIAGNTVGIAPKATIHAVKSMDKTGAGAISNVISGLNYVVSKKLANPTWPVLGSLSLSAPGSISLDQSILRAISNGVVLVAAAGNFNQDACSFSPSRVPEVITVGAINERDDKAFFSNFGSCVDIWAPGSNIKSVGITGPSATAIMSGTSMAGPHVVGILALMLSKNMVPVPMDEVDVANLRDMLVGMAAPNVGPSALVLAYHPCSAVTTCCISGAISNTC
eukprot:TRINITY_DN605_c0_g2_i1.p1 TRINITY_DN605_c0_g2~~TRINITY_DN605_c0_g2_i1.p1  ORF type:complete len:414 (-),score=53.90 TRINITY_DN605_c0_g2_i1:102-1343(-)